MTYFEKALKNVCKKTIQHTSSSRAAVFHIGEVTTLGAIHI
jgi:hypothetical protein